MAIHAATKHSPDSTTATGNTGHHDTQASAEQRTDHESDACVTLQTLASCASQGRLIVPPAPA